ncbi:MAG: TetR family transcriptional regulator [Deltaproteobacteria bacterium]|nr:TetR family transcriptional regulator [Deltaproteobacteria bacterium]
MDNRRKIIEVAIKLMSENGYEGTSLQMISDKVGIKKASIFHHFEKKEAILVAILKETIPSATYNLMLLVNNDSLNGCEKLKEFIRIHMGIIAEEGDVLKVYLTEFRHLSKGHKKKYLDTRRLYTDLVIRIVKEAREENSDRFEGLDPGIVANGLLGMCNWAVIWYKKNGRMSLEEISAQMFQMTKFSCLLEKNSQ